MTLPTVAQLLQQEGVAGRSAQHQPNAILPHIRVPCAYQRSDVLTWDLREPLRAGATDEELEAAIRNAQHGAVLDAVRPRAIA